MWDKFRQEPRDCVLYREQLEDLPLGIDAAAGGAELQATLPAGVLAHARECETCVETTEMFWLTRNVLWQGLVMAPEAVAVAEPSPWFATRVMAKIAECEAENRQLMLEWRRTVSRVASKLALVSAGALLVASTWVYDLSAQRAGKQAAQAGATKAEAGPPYLFDQASGAWSADDALVSPSEER
jgi:hypothetical protein